MYCGTKNTPRGRFLGTPNQCYRRGIGVGWKIGEEKGKVKGKTRGKHLQQIKSSHKQRLTLGDIKPSLGIRTLGLIARRRGIAGYSNMRVSQLVTAIKNDGFSFINLSTLKR